MRADLADAYTASLAHAVAPGPSFDGTRRRRIAEVAMAAYLATDPPPPWVRPYGDPVLDVAHRVARHAGTLTEEWYRLMVAEGIDPLQWVEIVGVAVAALAPAAFARAAGRPKADLPPATPGMPTGAFAPELAAARLNWVPVAAPADQRAAVLQALSALPDEDANLWRLAAAQYMSNEQMEDPGWSRGTLTRPQVELVATRLSLVRECFF